MADTAESTMKFWKTREQYFYDTSCNISIISWNPFVGAGVGGVPWAGVEGEGGQGRYSVPPHRTSGNNLYILNKPKYLVNYIRMVL